MTKKFAAEANQYGTEAYNMLMDVRSKGFTIVVREPAPRKACPTRLTYKKMEKNLAPLDHADERLAQLHAVMEAAKGQKNPYEYVRKWFLATYPDFNKQPKMNKENKVIGPTLLEDSELQEKAS